MCAEIQNSSISGFKLIVSWSFICGCDEKKKIKKKKKIERVQMHGLSVSLTLQDSTHLNQS